MDHKGDCPICGKVTENINNHVRMSGGDHGVRGEYPAAYDPASRTFDGQPRPQSPETPPAEPETPPPQSNDVSPSQIQESHSGNSEASEDRAESLELTDNPNDARSYNCGECGAAVGYLNDCPECGELLAWVGVQQESEA